MARFKRAYPRSIYIRQGQSPPAITAYQPKPFIARNPVPQRGQAGPLARAAGVGRAGVQTPQGTAGPPRPFVFRSPAPARARVGPQANICAVGVASKVVTPQGSPSSPPPRPVIVHMPPHRAKVGPGTYLATGRPGVQTPLGFQSQPPPRPVIVHVPPARARLGLRGQAAGGVPSAVSTPLGSPSQPAPRPVIQHLPPRRAWVGGSFGPYGGIGAPAAPAAQAYQAKPFVFRSPAPARARTGNNLACGDGVASSNVTPQGIAGPPKPFIFRSPLRARGRLGNSGASGDGYASQISTPLGSPSSPPPRPVIQHLPAHRAVWRGNASRNITPQGTTGPPRPFVFRSPLPARGRLGNNLLCGDGYASPVPTPQGAPSSPPPRPVLQHLLPHRAVWRGNASRNITLQGVAGPPRPFVWRSPLRARARLGNNLGCGDGYPSSISTPQGSPSSPPPRPVIQHLPPRRAVWRGLASRIVTPSGILAPPRKVQTFPPKVTRARIGAGSVAGGIASQAVTPSGLIPVTPPSIAPLYITLFPYRRAITGSRSAVAGGIFSTAVTPPPPIQIPPYAVSPVIGQRKTRRAVTGPRSSLAGGIASQAVTPSGLIPVTPPSIAPLYITLFPYRRAITGSRSAAAGGIASQVATPLGALPPARKVQAFPPRITRARIGHGTVSGGIASPAAITPVTPQPTIPVVEFRPPLRTSRAIWRGLAATLAPVTAAAYQRQVPQTRRPAPARVLWRGYASRTVTPLGALAPARKVQTFPPRITRATTGTGHVGAGIAALANTPPAAQPYRRPTPSIKRPAPARAWTGHSGTAAGYASRVVTPQGILAPPRKVPIFPPKITRAVTGHSTTAGGVFGPPNQISGFGTYRRIAPQIRRPAPARAWTGHGGPAGGIYGPINPASAAPQPTVPVVEFRPPPPPRGYSGPHRVIGAPPAAPAPPYAVSIIIGQRRIARAVTSARGGIASQVVTPPPVIPVSVYQRPTPQIKRPAPARAVLGPRGQVAAGIASQVVTPLGSLPALHRPLPPQSRRPSPARVLWRGLAVKAPPPTPQAYQRPAPQIKRPAPARGWVGHGTVFGGVVSPVVTPLGALPALHRPLPPQSIRPAPHRALWRGLASSIVTPPPVPPVIVPQPTWTVAPAVPLTVTVTPTVPLTVTVAPTAALGQQVILAQPQVTLNPELPPPIGQPS